MTTSLSLDANYTYSKDHTYPLGGLSVTYQGNEDAKHPLRITTGIGGALTIIGASSDHDSFTTKGALLSGHLGVGTVFKINNSLLLDTCFDGRGTKGFFSGTTTQGDDLSTYHQTSFIDVGPQLSIRLQPEESHLFMEAGLKAGAGIDVNNKSVAPMGAINFAFGFKR